MESSANHLKAFDIVEALATMPDWVSISEITEKTGLSKSTVHRLLTALCERGYVLRNEHARKYRLGLKILSISTQKLESLELRQHAKPHMIELMQKSRETVHLVTLEAYEGIYIEKIDTPESVGLLSRIGKRLPLYSTAVGKAILSRMEEALVDKYLACTPLVKVTEKTITDIELLKLELSKVRERGFALDIEENKEGIICVAAPILQANGEVHSGISVSGPSFRFSANDAYKYGPIVAGVGFEISSRLGYRKRV